MNLNEILELSGRTDTGCVRNNNEDFIGNDTELGVVVLADGMGGYKGGEIASAIAVNTILDELSSTLPPITARQANAKNSLSQVSLAARQSIIKANNTIFKTAQSQPQYQGMGTTIVLGIFYDNHLTITHVGDSRLYRYRDDQLEQITADHTLLQELVDRGFYTLEQARESLNKNLVTRALGIEASVAVDIKTKEVMPKDIYLLCSDGLNDMITDMEIRTIISANIDNIRRSSDELIALAKKNGGKDNISVLLVRPTQSFSSRKSWQKMLKDWLF